MRKCVDKNTHVHATTDRIRLLRYQYKKTEIGEEHHVSIIPLLSARLSFDVMLSPHTLLHSPLPSIAEPYLYNLHHSFTPSLLKWIVLLEQRGCHEK